MSVFRLILVSIFTLIQMSVLSLQLMSVSRSHYLRVVCITESGLYELSVEALLQSNIVWAICRELRLSEMLFTLLEHI